MITIINNYDAISLILMRFNLAIKHSKDTSTVGIYRFDITQIPP